MDGKGTDDIVAELRDWERIVDEAQGRATVTMLSGTVFGAAADEIDRLRALIREWNEANNFGSLHGDELTAAVDRLNAAEQALIGEARRG